ncbi:hypothetical protein AB1Y20_008210 [Prymnesium parvum]|uniref:Uncharacterized protein n=1 Tax=Prymnesium parvum TaxID=97485 RepID=A0AB34IW79_PRYPA
MMALLLPSCSQSADNLPPRWSEASRCPANRYGADGPPIHDAAPWLLVPPAARSAIEAAEKVRPAQRRAFTSLLSKLERQQPVSVVSVGGSMTAGMMCDDVLARRRMRNCSYPERFVELLRTAFYPPRERALLSHANRATGGTTTAAFLPQMDVLLAAHADAAVLADLLLVDFSANDEFEEQDWGLPSSAEVSRFLKQDKVFAATEVLLRRLAHVAPATAVLMVEGAAITTATGACHRQKLKCEPRLKEPRDVSGAQLAAQLYGMAYVRYPLMVKLRGVDYPRVNHPPYKIHIHIAAACLVWFCVFSSQLQQRELPELSSPVLLSRYVVCAKPQSRFDAASHFKRGNTSLETPQGDWRLLQDRPDKFGWIAHRRGQTIEFPLKFGPSPRVTLVYTQGYDRWGEVNVTFSGSSESFVLNAHHEQRTTVSSSLVMNVARNKMQRVDGGVKGFSIRPYETRTLRLRLLSKTFKIISVTSC